MKPDGLGESHWTELDPITKWLCVFPSCTNYGITSFSDVNQSPSCDMRRASLHLITKINSLAALDVWTLFKLLILPQSVLLSPLLFWSRWSQAEACLEMKQRLGVLPHGGPLDTYWGGLTCLVLGEWGRRGGGAEGESGPQQIHLIKSTSFL